MQSQSLRMYKGKYEKKKAHMQSQSLRTTKLCVKKKREAWLLRQEFYCVNQF